MQFYVVNQKCPISSSIFYNNLIQTWDLTRFNIWDETQIYTKLCWSNQCIVWFLFITKQLFNETIKEVKSDRPEIYSEVSHKYSYAITHEFNSIKHKTSVEYKISLLFRLWFHYAKNRNKIMASLKCVSSETIKLLSCQLLYSPLALAHHTTNSNAEKIPCSIARAVLQFLVSSVIFVNKSKLLWL